MRLEIISGSPRQNSQTKRVALHLLNRFKRSAELSVGLVSMDEIALPPVQKVFDSEFSFNY